VRSFYAVIHDSYCIYEPEATFFKGITYLSKFKKGYGAKYHCCLLPRYPFSGTNTAPVHLGLRELFEVFLETFEVAVVEGGARGIMCAYRFVVFLAGDEPSQLAVAVNDRGSGMDA
jgi:hypothetical protein